jgi:hypothetical protein
LSRRFNSSDFHGRSLIRIATAALLLSFQHVAVANEQDGTVVRDPHYGEVLFHFYQQDHFTALTHLDTAQSQQRVPNHAFEAELLKGGLMLSWGQHVEAGRIFENLLAAANDVGVRNRAWFYLGKVRYQRGYLTEAEEALESISDELPADLEAERFDLLARLYMDQGRFAEAVTLLESFGGADDWAAFASYNTGVALVRMGELTLGSRLLERVGTMRAPSEEQRALRDRANVALGFAYLQAQLEGDARPVLQRVRLNGPFSAKALLGAGWADSAQQNYKAALASWLELSGRDLLDSAVQESLLAVPYAFAQLGAEPQAADHYARALDIYSVELARLDTAIVDADSGRLIESLLAEDSSSADGWYWQLAQLPDDERSRYLFFTIADHRFHEALKSYRDLVTLDQHLARWTEKLDAYRDMLATRELAYGERLPLLQARVQQFDLVGMQRQYAAIEAATAGARRSGEATTVATAAELDAWQRLTALESNPAFNSEQTAEQRHKHRVLKGLVQWNMEREFRVRVWRQEQLNKELQANLAKAEQQFGSIDSATGSLDGTVDGFAARIARLQSVLDGNRNRLAGAMQDYERYLNDVALDELNGQKQRLLTYRAQARFALASIFDRMAAMNEREQ